MHNANIIQRDIKSDNMLIKKDPKTKEIKRVVLTDFGFTKKLKKGKKTMETNLGTPEYVAPEIILHGRSGKPADIWAAACTLLVARYGQQFSGSFDPNSNPKDLVLRSEIESGKQQNFNKVFLEYVQNSTEDIGKPRYYLDDYDLLLLKMLYTNPKKRLTAEQAYEEYQKIRKTGSI